MRREWTLMLYMAGDNDLGDVVHAKLKELNDIGSTDVADIVVQYDVPGNSHIQRVHIPKAGDVGKEIPPAAQQNSGDGRTLTDFITFSRTEFPSQRSILVIYDHGTGLDSDPTPHQNHAAPVANALQTRAKRNDADGPDLRAIRMRLQSLAPRLRSLFPAKALDHVQRITATSALQAMNTDETGGHFADGITLAISIDEPTGDFIDNLELQNALLEALRIGRRRDRFYIIGFEACLMNTFEIAYQLRTVCKFIVGSQSLIPREGWPYAGIIRSLHPALETAVVARKIVQAGANGIVGDDYITMSALDLYEANSVADAISKLADAMKKRLNDPTILRTITRAHYSAQSFAESETIDLVDFCTQLTSRAKDLNVPEIRDAAFAVENAASAFVAESQTRGPVVSNAHGVSIFFPKRRNVPSMYRELDFAKNTTWISFLESYLQKVFPTEEEALATQAGAAARSTSTRVRARHGNRHRKTRRNASRATGRRADR